MSDELQFVVTRTRLNWFQEGGVRGSLLKTVESSASHDKLKFIEHSL